MSQPKLLPVLAVSPTRPLGSHLDTMSSRGGSRNFQKGGGGAIACTGRAGPRSFTLKKKEIWPKIGGGGGGARPLRPPPLKSAPE